MRRFVLLLFVLCLSSTLTAGGLPSAAPEEVGLSSQKLALIDEAMEKYVADQKLAGIITVVARKGRIAHVSICGKADVEADKPLKRDAILRFYSMTKPITTTALMTLYEQGRFQLDDPVSKYLPEFKDVTVFVSKKNGEVKTEPPKREMTIRDLLRHTSGLTYGLFGTTEVDRMYRAANVLDRTSDLEQMVEKLGKIPLLFHPGERWNYSVSVDVQGRLIEVLSGVPFDEFLQTQIFKPLGMSDSGFYVPSDKADRLAANYGPQPGGSLRVIDAPGNSEFLSPPGLVSGGGGLVSTADDYVRFAQMMLNKGSLDDVRILKPETVELMTTNHLPDELIPIRLTIISLKHTGFGLGVSVRVDKDAEEPDGVIGEYGWAGAASTFFFVSPKEEMVCLALTQFMPISFGFSQEFRKLAYEAIVEPVGGK